MGSDRLPLRKDAPDLEQLAGDYIKSLISADDIIPPRDILVREIATYYLEEWLLNDTDLDNEQKFRKEVDWYAEQIDYYLT